MDGISFSEGLNELLGFGPGVLGESELVVMDGEDRFGLQIQYGVLQIFGGGVNQRPVVVVLPVFQKRQIDLSELLSDTFETSVIASVAADINLAVPIFDHERCPERLIACSQQTI